MRKVLIIAGILMVFFGLFWPWISRIPLGRLPGDIIIDRPNFKVFIPITTMVLISLLVSLIIWLFRNR